MQPDFNKLPKQFTESIVTGYTEDYFALAILSGENVAGFALTPEHAKRLAQSLAHNVEDYERRFGEIHADWKPGIESPFQIPDTGNNKKK
jgi:hypothetical protein